MYAVLEKLLIFKLISSIFLRVILYLLLDVIVTNVLMVTNFLSFVKNSVFVVDKIRVSLYTK